MKYIFSTATIFCFVCIFACREKPATRPTVTNRQLSLPTGSPATTPANPVLPVNNPVVPTINAQQTINPAHGQPGHRCDVAVGAPIPALAKSTNTAIPAPVTANPTVQPTSLPVATVAPTVATPGLNPAHGQPGHRCDIAVGAPLSSQPAAKPQPATAASPTVTKPQVLQPDTLFAKGLNPAHGQPGHRCDVAVGKPLNEPKKADTTTNAAIQLKPASGN